MTESELIAQAGGGDRQAIRELYNRYEAQVLAVVRRISGDEDTARDQSQEAWLRAIRALPTFRGEAQFSTWLHRIAVNVALESTRRAAAMQTREVPLPDALPARVERGDVLLANRLRAALSRLPSGMREVLILHDVEQYTHEEIADALGITAGTSKSQLFKARARMRALLTGKLPSPTGPELDERHTMTKVSGGKSGNGGGRSQGIEDGRGDRGRVDRENVAQQTTAPQKVGPQKVEQAKATQGRPVQRNSPEAMLRATAGTIDEASPNEGAEA